MKKKSGLAVRAKKASLRREVDREARRREFARWRLVYGSNTGFVEWVRKRAISVAQAKHAAAPTGLWFERGIIWCTISPPPLRGAPSSEGAFGRHGALACRGRCMLRLRYIDLPGIGCGALLFWGGFGGRCGVGTAVRVRGLAMGWQSFSRRW